MEEVKKNNIKCGLQELGLTVLSMLILKIINRK